MWMTLSTSSEVEVLPNNRTSNQRVLMQSFFRHLNIFFEKGGVAVGCVALRKGPSSSQSILAVTIRSRWHLQRESLGHRVPFHLLQSSSPMAGTTVGDASAGLDDALETAIATITIIKLTKMCFLSTTVLYVYDMLTTYDREVEFMWKSGIGTLGRLLYFAIRYCTLFVMIATTIVLFLPQASSEVCQAWLRFYLLMGIILTICIEFALQIRIYAMYNKSRKIFALLSASLFCVLLADIIIAVFAFKGQTAEFVNIGPGSYMHICATISMPNWYKAYWTPRTLNEVLLFALALNKAIQSFRSHGLGSQNRGMNLLVRDSILYFFVVFIVYVANWIIWDVKGVDYIMIPCGFSMSLMGIMSQKLLVNLVEHFSERALTVQWSEDSKPSTILGPRHVHVEEQSSWISK